MSRQPHFPGLWATLVLGLGACADAPTEPEPVLALEAILSIERARGTFEVTLSPDRVDDESASTRLDRMRIEKTFAGDLAGTGRGELLTAVTSVPGSAGYVALERVEGTLGGYAGSFVLQHSGITSGDLQDQAIVVVPGSGTGGLQGLAGRMTVTIVGGVHSYVLEYWFED